MSARKKYAIKTSCPQCGCSAVSHLSHEEMMERFGDVHNVELECGACMVKISAKMTNACPEWDQECKANAGRLRQVKWKTDAETKKQVHYTCTAAATG